jgi:hypothetical protein
MNIRSFLLIILFGGNLVLHSQSLQRDVIQRIKEATVYIEISHQFPLTNEKVPKSGTGFFITPYGHVVTNYHVVQPLISYYNMNFPAPVAEIKVIQHSGTQKHKSFQAHVLAVDKAHDLAILGISQKAETAFLKIDEGDTLIETMPVWAFGYPFGEAFSVIQRGPEISITKGAVTALRHNDRDTLTDIQIDATVNPGNSGGPLINARGRCIGVVKIAIGTSHMNFAVPHLYLRNLIGKVNVEVSAPESVSVTFSSVPEARLFIDWNDRGAMPLSDVKLKTGWHRLCVMKQGFQSWIQEKTFTEDETVNITLTPLREVSLGKKGKETGIQSGRAYDTAWQNLRHNIPADSKAVLLEEDFNDPAAFKEWEQSTGGMEKRTWFIENGVLNQFESDKVLHAIYLGDTSWTNYIVKAKMRIKDEHDDSRAGLIFRETEDGFYLFRIHKETDKAQLAYHCKGPFGWFIIMERTLGMDVSDTWYELTVHALDNAFACFLDTGWIFTGHGDYTKQGRIGFYSVESKASFDSLRVCAVPTTFSSPVTHQATEPLSFWFADHFNLQSTWWYQYEEGEGKPHPWVYTEGGFAQMVEDKTERVSEFTKYALKDFSMDLLVSLGRATEKSAFNIIFRKNNRGYLCFNFSKSDRMVRLIVVKQSRADTLKERMLPSKFFENIQRLNLVANKGFFTIRTGEHGLLKYHGRFVPTDAGRLAFSCRNLKLILHQMTVSSVLKEPIFVPKKKVPKRRGFLEKFKSLFRSE